MYGFSVNSCSRTWNAGLAARSPRPAAACSSTMRWCSRSSMPTLPLKQQPPQPARSLAVCSASTQAGEVLSMDEWDVVLYQPDQTCRAVGRVSQLQPQSATIERLEEEGEGLWAVSDQVDIVPLSSVQQVLEADYMQLVDSDRISNPHGEHAHEAFRIVVPIPPGLWGERLKK